MDLALRGITFSCAKKEEGESQQIIIITSKRDSPHKAKDIYPQRMSHISPHVL